MGGGEPNKSHIHKLRWQPPWAIGIARNLLELLAQYKATGVNSDFQSRQSYLEQLQDANGRDIDSWGNCYFLSPHSFPFCSLAKWVFLQMLEALISDENYVVFYGRPQVVSTRMKKISIFPWIHSGNSVYTYNKVTGSWFLLGTGEAGCLTKWFVFVEQIGKGLLCLELIKKKPKKLSTHKKELNPDESKFKS